MIKDVAEIENKIRLLKEKQRKAKLENKRFLQEQTKISYEIIGECFHKLLSSEDPEDKRVANKFWNQFLFPIFIKEISTHPKRADPASQAIERILKLKTKVDIIEDS